MIPTHVHNFIFRNVHVYFINDIFNKKQSVVSFVGYSYLKHITNCNNKKDILNVDSISLQIIWLFVLFMYGFKE